MIATNKRMTCKFPLHWRCLVYGIDNSFCEIFLPLLQGINISISTKTGDTHSEWIQYQLRLWFTARAKPVVTRPTNPKRAGPASLSKNMVPRGSPTELIGSRRRGFSLLELEAHRLSIGSHCGFSIGELKVHRYLEAFLWALGSQQS